MPEQALTSRPMRIEKAYCVELDRVVDIEQAREAFFSKEWPSRFTFLCSDDSCRYSNAIGVHVSGINYDKDPEIDVFFKTPHFRQKDQHIPNCCWVEIEEAESQDKSSAQQVERIHHLRKKDVTVITRFSIPLADNVGQRRAQEDDDIEKIRRIQSKPERISAYRKIFSGGGSSSRSLETLVSCFEELKNEKALDITIHVDGHGDYKFDELFQHIKKINHDDRFHIYYGGARLAKRYRDGFKLIFFDKIKAEEQEGQSVSLYIPPETSQKTRHLLDVINTAEKSNGAYLTIYWIGGVVQNEHGLNVHTDTPKHITFRFKIRQKI